MKPQERSLAALLRSHFAPLGQQVFLSRDLAKISLFPAVAFTQVSSRKPGAIQYLHCPAPTHGLPYPFVLTSYPFTLDNI